ncbi:MAG TPA: amino acid ABC transporter permease [Xanthobacteraceae bacterium]|nr:amino acid ABC transporter permease [Xanthobacteraceae bacterium]
MGSVSSSATPDGASARSKAYVRTAFAAPAAPPAMTTGVLGWLRANLFSSVPNTILTVLVVALIVWVAVPIVKFLLIDAVWSGHDREACLASAEQPVVGACWAFVRDRFAYFIYGSYPLDQRWRVDIFFGLLIFGIVWLLSFRAPRRDLGAIYFFIVLPVASFVLLYGVGLPRVDTASWGGLLVTLVVAAVGIAVSLPLGIVLALGRRSRLPVIKVLSVSFIEFVRGVPLITVLFMASVMLPLFVPEQWSPDKLMRALVGVALFSSAYMAEVVRAGLQAVPKGQYEAAKALGLGYWPMMRLIVLPQALKTTIPNIVNSYIALFKDTTLVFFVGIFDFLKTIEVARVDPKWATPVTSATGYAFAALFYLVCCYLMSDYASRFERRVSAGERR